MDHYIDLADDPSALAHLLRRLHLADDAAPATLTPLTGGVSSNIFRLDIGDETYCLKQALPKLKVAKDWIVPVERVYAEIGWLRTAGRIVPGHVPEVLGVDHETKSFVMAFLPPTYANWKRELMDGRVDPAIAAQLGDVLGRIHAATAGDAEIAARFANDDTFHAIRLEPYLEEAARQNPQVAAALRSLIERTAGTREALVHGDVSPKNILLGPAGPVILDAECAWYGDPAFDVAFCLNHFLLKSARSPGALAALMLSFAKLVEHYVPHIEWTKPDVLLERVASLLAALLLARVDGKSPVEYLDEHRRARVRAAAIELIGRPDSTLSDITTFWQREFSA
ncbi:aminoglycoside phosphotransferase [Caballeronia jiangsuensis]|nr:aminoglycoside phosphotransferase [Caballeronia jiangsuensis]